LSVYCYCVFSSYFLFQRSRDHLARHSFPTRRSSDLGAVLQRHLGDGRDLAAERRGHRHAARPLAAVGGGERAALPAAGELADGRSEEHTSELQSQSNLVCRLLLEKKKK